MQTQPKVYVIHHRHDNGYVTIGSSSNTVWGQCEVFILDGPGASPHTVTHTRLSSPQHDFVVVMATTAHSYLTDLPWDEVKEMKESCWCVVHEYEKVIVNCGWSIIDNSAIM